MNIVNFRGQQNRKIKQKYETRFYEEFYQRKNRGDYF